MSVTFYISRESVEVVDGEPRILYKPVYPRDFDPRQVVSVDPDYGPEYAANPWQFNVSNENARYLLSLVGIEPEDLSGNLANVAALADACIEALATVVLNPALDAAQNATGEHGSNWMQCGRPERYSSTRLNHLLTLAHIAKEHNAVVSFA